MMKHPIMNFTCLKEKKGGDMTQSYNKCPHTISVAFYDRHGDTEELFMS